MKIPGVLNTSKPLPSSYLSDTGHFSIFCEFLKTVCIFVYLAVSDTGHSMRLESK
jgi:hypothetical protein